MLLLDFAIDNTNKYILKHTKKDRKKLGQFFTSKETAVFMADLFTDIESETLRILDPGAGTGILSVAIVDRFAKNPRVKSINLVCYETDDKVLEVLYANLEFLRQNIKTNFKYEIRTMDYITSQSHQYNNRTPSEVFDYIICNPPFMKIEKDHLAAKSMPDVCYGAPNLYFLFMAMSSFNLTNNGQMVYIIPRSWTSGLYFQKFRAKFLKECFLTNIHLFASRNKVFGNEDVLQETMIAKAQKGCGIPDFIRISATNGNEDFSNLTTFDAPYHTVVSEKNNYVLLITCAEDIRIVNKVNQHTHTLPELGLSMKTGLAVDFRISDLLRNNPEPNAIPLFYSYHLKNGAVSFPVGRSNEYILTNRPGLLQKNQNYLFIKRFTAKEELRRLQCSIYLSKQYPEYSYISTDNKINFICGVSPLSDIIVYGLYVVFNSTLYDRYYRILNGSTQVNSSEINSIPMPSLKTIEEMGSILVDSNNLSIQMCDSILRQFV